VLSTNPFYTFVNRIYQQDLVTGYPCGDPGEPCDGQSRPYYRPNNNVTRQQMAKFIDNARRLSEIHIEVITGTAPIYVRNNSGTAISAISTSGVAVSGDSANLVGIAGNSDSGSGVVGDSVSGYGVAGHSSSLIAVGGNSDSGTGVVGESISGIGVVGNSDSLVGVAGNSDSGTGVVGDSVSGYGVAGHSSSLIAVGGNSDSGTGVVGESITGTGVYGRTSDASGNWAGDFQGNVNVTGTCCNAGAGTYKIDNPLDPRNKYLYHSAVQSPDMMDVYNGNVTTDNKGEATITLPLYFEALNRDFRYQLTPIGQFAQVMVSSEIKNNRFSVRTDKPNIKVSWQVTGIRQDAYANAHRTPVEVDKPVGEEGKYLHPTELGQPASSGVNYEKARNMHQAVQSKP
jgi:hypothetical protein